MDIDLIKKLIKLANNNPNDNEANLAARKVCKMLDGHEFLVPSKSRADILDEFFRQTRAQQAAYDKNWGQGSWTGFGRSYETGRPPPGSDREAKKAPTETSSSPHQGTNRDPYADYKEAWEGVYGVGNEWPGGNIKRNLKCKTCGHTKSTRFRGLPDNWICMECRGKEYMKSKL